MCVYKRAGMCVCMRARKCAHTHSHTHAGITGMSVRTRPCLHAHTGVYVDTNARTHTQMSSFAQRMSGRGWTHIYSHLHGCAHTRALKKLTHTRARTRTNMHVRASWHYIACARTRTCICALCVLVGPHMCLQLHRHVCLCTRNASKHANVHTRKHFFNTYMVLHMCAHEETYIGKAKAARCAL